MSEIWTKAAPYPGLQGTRETWLHGAPDQTLTEAGGAIVRSGVASTAGVSSTSYIGSYAGVAPVIAATAGASTAAAVGLAIPPLPEATDIPSWPFIYDSIPLAYNEIEWYRYVASGAMMIGIRAASDVEENSAEVTLYIADPSDPIVLVEKGDASASTGGFFYPLVSGQIAYFELAGGYLASGATFVGEVMPADIPVSYGSLIINDDTAPWFAAVQSPTTGLVVSYLSEVPAGEMGASIPGYVLAMNEQTDPYGAKVFGTSNWATAGEFAPFGQFRSPIATNGRDTFYPSRFSGGQQLYVSWIKPRLGTASEDEWQVDLTGEGTPKLLAVNTAGTQLLYHIPMGSPFNVVTIQSYDLVTREKTGTFYEISAGFGETVVAGVTPNNHPAEILTLYDGTYVIWCLRFNGGIGQGELHHVSAAGVLLHLVTFDEDTYGEINHISPVASTNSEEIWVWFYTTGVSGAEMPAAFRRVNLITGASSPDLDVAESSQGYSTPSSTMFAHSNSCFLATSLQALVTEVTAVPEGGPMPTCCDTPPSETGPNPVGALPPWVDVCTNGGVVDEVPDLVLGEVW